MSTETPYTKYPPVPEGRRRVITLVIEDNAAFAVPARVVHALIGHTGQVAVTPVFADGNPARITRSTAARAARITRLTVDADIHYDGHIMVGSDCMEDVSAVEEALPYIDRFIPRRLASLE